MIYIFALFIQHGTPEYAPKRGLVISLLSNA